MEVKFSTFVVWIFLAIAASLPTAFAKNGGLFLRTEQEAKQEGQAAQTDPLEDGPTDSCAQSSDKNGNRRSCWRNHGDMICIVLFRANRDGGDHAVPQDGDKVLQEWCWDGEDTYTHVVQNVFEKSNEISAASYESKLSEFCLDSDGDMYCDQVDNCPDVPNRNQTDLNFNQIGDACDDELETVVQQKLGGLVKNGTDVPLQTLSESGTLFDADGDELDIDKAENASSTPEGAVCTIDGNPVECGRNNCVTRGKTGAKSYVIQKNCTTGVAQTILIIDEGGRSTEVVLVDAENLIYATITPDDYDEEALARDFKFGEEENNLPFVGDGILPTDARKLRENKNPSDFVLPRRRTQAQPCSNWNVIEIAIAYESSFCISVGGAESAENKVNAVFEATKVKYEMICVRLVMSHLEGHCDPDTDPYKAMVELKRSGCGSFGLLQLFGDLWNTQRLPIHRDTAHLFSGTELECDGNGCTLGCATKGTLCDVEAAYGVNYISPSLFLNIQAVLFAHELGHNGNMDHVDRNDKSVCENGQYIMCSSANPAQDGWSPASVTSLFETIASTSCVSSIPVECGSDSQCDDGNACNGYETCNLAGECEAGALLDCNNGSFCNGQRTCNPVDGSCSTVASTCDDGNSCNGIEFCDEGKDICSPQIPTCDDVTLEFSSTYNGYSGGGAFFDLASPLRTVRLKSVELYLFGSGSVEVHIRDGRSVDWLRNPVGLWTQIAQKPISSDSAVTKITIPFDAPLEMPFGKSVAMYIYATDGVNFFYFDYDGRQVSRREESTIDLRVSHSFWALEPFGVSPPYYSSDIAGLSITYSIDVPTDTPSAAPSSVPSALPSWEPSPTPSNGPSQEPSSNPSFVPSTNPSYTPSFSPTLSLRPSNAPSLSLAPSISPSVLPSFLPSVDPAIAQRAALVSLYNSAGGIGWSIGSNWLSEMNYCDWYGVFCGERGNVERLDLSFNNLVGSLPSQIGDLVFLKELILENNGGLTNRIPPEIESLKLLEVLHLTNAGISGTIPPEIGFLRNLRSIRLESTKLTGSIPTEIGDLESLEEVRVNYVSISGIIPTQIGLLQNLETLILTEPQISGSIPTEIGKCSSLKTISMFRSMISGTMPSEIGSLANLQTLWLQITNVSGGIPSALGSLKNLSNLRLADNDISGSIPPEIGDCSGLVEVWLDNTSVSGTIPSSFGGLTKLRTIRIQKTSIAGDIPDFFCDLFVSGDLFSIYTASLENPLSSSPRLTGIIRDDSDPSLAVAECKCAVLPYTDTSTCSVASF